MYEHLENWLRNKNDMVVYEAARSICEVKDVSAKELFPAVTGWPIFFHFSFFFLKRNENHSNNLFVYVDIKFSFYI